MDKEYIRNKINKSKLEYLHPDLEPVLETSQGVMLYQEQALKVFGIAGFAEDEQDNARRAIGKKKEKLMKSFFAQFSDGLSARGWNEEQINEMWRLIEAQAGYSFNLGHSTAYGLLSYVTAYLKHYYPKEFMTSLLTSEIGDYEQTTKYINECNRMGIDVLAPDINVSEKYYTVAKDGILFGFESIKGVGGNAAEVIINERSNGNFKGLDDFIQRCKVDSSTVIALIKSGAFGSEKDMLLCKYAELDAPKYNFKPVSTIPSKLKLIEFGVISSDEEFKDKDKCLNGYNEYKKGEYDSKFRKRTEKHLNEFKEKYMAIPEMYEYETLSIFINGNPFDDVKSYFTKFEEYEDNAKCVVCGTITSVKRKKQKNGKQYAYLEILTPEEGMIEGVAFNTQLTQYQDIITKGNNVIILAEKNGGQFKTDKIKTLDQWKEERGIK